MNLTKLAYIIVMYFITAIFTFALATPYTWKIVRVVDGDTIVFAVDWLPKELGNTISVRVVGIDTPEKSHIAKCDKEKELGKKASEYTKSLFAGKKEAQVTILHWDKYGGRLNGYVSINGKDLGETLIKAGYARPYDGGKKSNWCV